MSRKGELASRKVYRLPCHLTETAFRNLHAALCEQHGRVRINVDSEAGPRTDVPVDTLLKTGWWGRIETVTIECAEPTLRLQLSDFPFREVTVSWDASSSAISEASLKKFGVSHWFNPLQLPCHFFLALYLTLGLLWLAGSIGGQRGVAAEIQRLQSAEDNLERAVATGRYTAEDIAEARRVLAEARSKRSQPRPFPLRAYPRGGSTRRRVPPPG